MDKIIIRGLEVSACHGVKDFEKTCPQPFVFDADLYYDFNGAYYSDDLKDTLNYSSASKIIVKTAAENSFNLIEKLAYECAYAVMNALPAKKITLTVYKPQAPMKQKFGSVGVTLEVERNTVYLSLGSSMGDRQKFLDYGIGRLEAHPQIKIKKVSSYIETEPCGGVAQNKFLNCAAEIETLLSPQELLRFINSVENGAGRVRERRWADRTLDIDIIFFGRKIIREENLCVPHPEYFRRGFVLAPLNEIAPAFRCPVLDKTVNELLCNLHKNF